MHADALPHLPDASAAEGVVIQSPDGRPAGIFFRPGTPSQAFPSATKHPSTTPSTPAVEVPGAPPTETWSEAWRQGHLLQPKADLHGALSANSPALVTPVDHLQHGLGSPPARSPHFASLGQTIEQHAEANGATRPSINDGSASSPDETRAGSTRFGSGSGIDRSSSVADPLSAPLASANTNLFAHPSDANANKGHRPGITPLAEAGAPPMPSASSSARPRMSRNSALMGGVPMVNSLSGGAASNTSRRSGQGSSTASTPLTQSPPKLNAAAINGGHVAVRPSAQPQSGLLIGAGFASRASRGHLPRRAPLREEVYPPIRVLIVEDNPINRKILSTFLGKKKIQHDIARDGREAVEKWQTGSFHLILMDIQLPVMDGIEATKEIRRLERLSNIGQHGVAIPGPSTLTAPPQTPSALNAALVAANGQNHHAHQHQVFRASVIIVALTASAFNSDRVAALAAGCNDFLNKPVSLAWLEKKVTEWGAMQYLLLAGDQTWHTLRATNSLSAASANPSSQRAATAVADRLRRAGVGGAQAFGSRTSAPTASAAAASSAEIRRGFGAVPDHNARQLASRLHLAPRNRSAAAAATAAAAAAGTKTAAPAPAPAAGASAAPTAPANGETRPAPNGDATEPPTSTLAAEESSSAATSRGAVQEGDASAPTSVGPSEPRPADDDHADMAED